MPDCHLACEELDDAGIASAFRELGLSMQIVRQDWVASKPAELPMTVDIVETEGEELAVVFDTGDHWVVACGKKKDGAMRMADIPRPLYFNSLDSPDSDLPRVVRRWEKEVGVRVKRVPADAPQALTDCRGRSCGSWVVWFARQWLQTGACSGTKCASILASDAGKGILASVKTAATSPLIVFIFLIAVVVAVFTGLKVFGMNLFERNKGEARPIQWNV